MNARALLFVISLKIQEHIRFLPISTSHAIFFAHKTLFPILRCRLMISSENQTEENFPVAVITIAYKIPFQQSTSFSGQDQLPVFGWYGANKSN